jgi:zinc protease
MLALVLLMSCGPKVAPPLSAADRALTAPFAPDAALPTDPSVRSGVLENGLAWYVEENALPETRAELRLVVKVGSVVEDDDQRGLAHFIEHMAFNGSEHFKGNGLIDYMESIGMDFGAHLNAYTSFDQTVYMLTVPTDDPALLDKGLLVLRDQGSALLLEPEEIERERGVVLEEWRSRRGARGRIGDAQVASTFQGARYADRLPIGTEESLKGFEHDALRRYFTDWYRPDLMAVVAVGDFDGAAVEALIHKHFDDMTGPAEPRERVAYGIPERGAPVITVITDPEIPRTGFNVTDQLDEPEGSTYADYRSNLTRSLFLSVVNERFTNLAKDPAANLLGAGAGSGRTNALEASWSLGGAAPEGKHSEAIRSVLTEVERMRRHGVTDAELTRAKAGLLSSYERMYQEREKTQSDTHAEEIIRVITTNESMPGMEAEYGFAKSWVPAITQAQVNAMAKDWMHRGSLVFQVVMPEKEGLTPITVAEIEALIAEVEAADVAPPAAEAEVGPLLAELPVDGPTIVDRNVIEELQLVIWTLSNGVTIWLKPTDFKDDQILLKAVSHGGVSTAPDADYVAASTAAAIAGRSGLGTFDSVALDKRLSGVRASAGAGIGRWDEKISGSTPPGELETMLQLVTLRMTAPAFSEEGLARYRRSREEGLRNRLSNPAAVFSDDKSEVRWNDSIRGNPWTPETLDQLDLAKSEAFYKSRFANAADFTWMFVGNLDLDAMEPLIVRYLGNLPTDEAREQPGDDGLDRRPGQHQVLTRAGIEPKARVDLSWHGPMENTWLQRNRLQALEDILSVRLREVLREDMGGVYGVSVGGGTWDLPSQNYYFDISFGCDPERVDELRAAVDAELKRIVAEPVTAEEVTVEQEKNRRDREERIRTNGFWLGGTLSALSRGDDPRDLMTWDARNDSLNPDEIQAMAVKVFSKDAHRIEAVLLPEEGAATPGEDSGPE